MIDKGSLGLKTLPKAIREYLKNVEDRTEISVLKQFNNFMKANHGRVTVCEVDTMHFEQFLRSLSVSEESLKSNRSRLNRFKRHIGLSISSNRGRRSKKTEIKKLKRQLAEKDAVTAKHLETLNRKDGEIKELNQKLIEKKSMEGLRPLETSKAQLEKQIAELEIAKEQMSKRVKPYLVQCPLSGEIKSLGNDCSHCPKYASCPLSGGAILTVEPEKEEG